MPTKGELQRPDHLSLQFCNQEPSHSWTDDLPVCPFSGVGYSTNQVYRRDGTPSEEHEFEDKIFHVRADDVYFYGLFDGHCGKKAAHFAAQRMPAEILLGQLKGNESDKNIKELLRKAFSTVEKGFFESIDDLLAEKANLEFQLQEAGMYATYRNQPEIIDCLRTISSEISGGTTAAVALIVKNKLYVANVGNSRAVLCKIDQNNLIDVQQLSVDHDIDNDDELLRLSELGMDVEKICKQGKLGNQENTRCIGNYMVKGGYRDFDSILREASQEPVIAEPEMCGGIQIDDSCRFLLLMSSGLYKSLKEATGTKQANLDICKMVIEQFSMHTTITGVAQAVVDKIVRIHHDMYLNSPESLTVCQKRDDITLIVRNFNQLLPSSATPSQTSSSMTSSVDELKTIKRMGGNIITSRPDPEPEIYSESNSASNTESLMSNQSEQENGQMLFQSLRSHSLPLNERGRINPYVDFSNFYKAIEEAKKQGKKVPEGCDT
ncbi:TGF-beta-activated kinase 1 and MAP3K7-binding protein 1-like isoform X1 [Centruroides vittatus]|uniref:TGF-beta-activated kinase 1 and MAP3K7-binding protein 1-like isoform X1 n=1 Tax=Centruroides vittatus TaxID=120091 RepID=UPI003510784F